MKLRNYGSRRLTGARLVSGLVDRINGTFLDVDPVTALAVPVPDGAKNISDAGGLPIPGPFTGIQDGVRKDVRLKMGEWDEGIPLSELEIYYNWPEEYGYQLIPAGEKVYVG